MKNLKLLLIPFVCLMMAINFVSCDKEDSEPSNSNNNFIGTWDSEFLGRMSRDELESMDLNDKTITNHYEYFTFNKDNTGYDIYYDGSRTDWEWEIIDETLYLSDGKYYEIVKYNKNVIYLLRLSSYPAGLKLVRK